MGTAFELLQAHYQARLMAAKTARANGAAGVVGLTGPTAPSELVLAAGLFPVRISAPAGMATPTADHYLDAVLAGDIRALFESTMRGDLEFLDLLVLTRAEDKLFYFLKEMVRLGRAAAVPPLHMLDLMGSQREAVRTYNLQNFNWLLAVLERLSGNAISDEHLHAAIQLTNRCRELLRELMARRWTGELSGVDAMQVIGAGFHMHPIQYAQALESFLQQLTAPPRRQCPRLLIASSQPLSSLDLHERLEAAGALVVAEDDAWGSRAASGDIASTPDPRQATFEKYWRDTAHAGINPREARQAWFLAQLQRDDLDAVVFYVPPGDHQFGWDYPRLAAQVLAAGKGSLLLRQDAADVAVEGAIREFVSALSTRRTHHVND